MHYHRLKTIRIYYLTVSIGEEPGHGFSAQGLTRLKLRCLLLCSHLKLGSLFQTVGRIQFLVVVGLRSPFSC